MKATINKVKFIQNNNTNICTMEACIKYNHNTVMKTYWLGLLQSSDFRRKFPHVKINFVQGTIKITTVGKAKRMNEDKDSIVGKRLAESRAKEKVFRTVSKISNFLKEIMTKDTVIMEAEILRYKFMECREIFHQKELIENE